MTVIEERHGERGQPHAIQTPLGWTASNGHFQLGATDLSTRRVVVSQTDDEKDLKILKLQETIRDLVVENETIQASINDGKARLMVEGNIKVCKNRYQIPVPLKENVTSIPDNFDLAAKRLGFLRKRMLKDPEPTSKVEQSMQELKDYGAIKPAKPEQTNVTNYLPYYLTDQTKPRVVYDGSVPWKKHCINNAIYSGPDELNVLSRVLARFRLGSLP